MVDALDRGSSSPTTQRIRPQGRMISGTSQTFESLENILFIAFLAGLAWVPAWLGSNRIVPWGINAVYFGLILLAYEASILLSGRRHPVGIRRFLYPAAAFVAVCLWILVQMATFLPAFMLHPIWGAAAEATGDLLHGSISVNRDLTMLGFIRLLTAGSVLWLSIQLCRNEKRSHFLLQWIAIVGAVYALYGFVTNALFSGSIFWFEVPDMLPFVRSTFVNRNSAATYFGMTFVASCSCLFRLYQHSGHAGASLRMRIVTMLETTAQRGWFFIAATFLSLSGLLLSGSRAGILCTTLGLFVLVILMFQRRKRKTEILEAILFLTVGLVLTFIFFGDILVGRIMTTGFGDASRLSAYWIVLQSIKDELLLGFGYSTFPDVFPLYRDRSVPILGSWDKAHNTYLELFQGLGVPGACLLIASVGALGYRCAVGALKRQQSIAPSCVATAVVVLVGTHAFVDFSLQIQAVTLTFMALLGCGLAQAESSRHNLAD